jgi:hypothetical protein
MEDISIRLSKTGEYYEMRVNGKFVGSYDTYSEARKDYNKEFGEKQCTQNTVLKPDTLTTLK